MTPIVSLDRALAQLRIEPGADDEEYVQGLLAVAEDVVSLYLNRPLKPWSTEQDLPPASVQHAILLHVTDLYENRSAVVWSSVPQINPTVDRLLYPHRVGLGV